MRIVIPAQTSWVEMRAQRTHERLMCPNRAILLMNRGADQHGDKNQSTGRRRTYLSRVSCAVHYSDGAVFYLRVYHQPEHGTGAAPEGDFHASLCMGDARRVSFL